MKFDKSMMQLYAITDRYWVGELSLIEQIELVLQNGATCLQLREKDLDDDEFLKEAFEVKALCKKYNVPFIINDNVDIAIKCGADGVHVGQEDMNAGEIRKKVGKDMIIGVSAHTIEETVEAIKNGADYLGLGAAFSTSTKTDCDVMPAETMKAICDVSTVPTVAIGGINSFNVMQLAGRGLDGISVISALFGAKDIASATKELLTLSKKMVNNE